MEFLWSARGPNGGWTQAQLAVLGLVKAGRGWIKGVVGREIENAEAEAILMLAGVGAEVAFEDDPFERPAPSRWKKREKRKKGKGRSWANLSPEERQRRQDWHIQQAEKRKANDPRKAKKRRDQLEALIAERKAMFGDSWRENAPFDIPDGV